MSDMKKEKLAFIIAVIYIAFMGLGMFVMNNFFGIKYSDPQMVTVIIFVEIILTAFTLFANYKWFNNSGFEKLDKAQIKWFMPMAVMIMMTLLIYLLTSQWMMADIFLVFLIVSTCAFVGISEEVMFRGILLHTLLGKVSKTRAIMLSAVMFSLLHSVNMFAGVSFQQMLAQLMMTFVVGILFACVAVKIKNIVPLIIYHGLWDTLVISSSVTGAKISYLILLLTLLHLVLALLYLVIIKKEEKISILKEE